jgi:hypothetical protein
MTLYKWAQRHGVSIGAIKELETLFGIEEPVGHIATGLSEAAVQQNLRLEASRKGVRLFRNNVGAFHDPDTGSFVRYGLANESAQVNAVIKSGDLIGIRPVLIEPHHFGTIIGQFVSREAKPGDWRYSATDREVAQLAWITLITSMGGDAKFATGEGTL